ALLAQAATIAARNACHPARNASPRICFFRSVHNFQLFAGPLAPSWAILAAERLALRSASNPLGRLHPRTGRRQRQDDWGAPRASQWDPRRVGKQTDRELLKRNRQAKESVSDRIET